MARTIAVDDKLANVRQALENQGYNVASLKEGLDKAAVVVVSGMDDDLLGDQSITTKAAVIQAAGLSAEQVINEVEKAIQLRY
ncbi:MAG: YkuS family protein [Firmicutes bacterium]|jgi:hypothetical protein|nr:YkuS family protein [Bacillota bacterium]